MNLVAGLGVGEESEFITRRSVMSCVKSTPNNIVGSRCSSGKLLSAALGVT